MEKKNTGRRNNPINSHLWIIIIISSIIFIAIAHNYAMAGNVAFQHEGPETYKAKVTKIIDQGETENLFNPDSEVSDYLIYFQCKILDGKEEGKVIRANQLISASYKGAELEKHIEVGDLILVSLINKQDNIWGFAGYYRLNKILVLGIVFAAITLLIGKKKGMNALISLTFTAMFVFSVFIPWILGGHNIYLGVALTCIFTIIMSLLLIEGATTKSFVTIVSCIIGTCISAFIPMIMNNALHLTGMIDEHSTYLLILNPEAEINLVEILYSGIIIGSLGAIMDVAMDISSSLYEITIHVPKIPFKKLCKSGMEISRDIIGTMTNTLVLAYIGSSLSSILLLITYTSSVMELLNREMIISEMLQTFVGSIALLLTAPITVVIAAYVYTHWVRKKDSQIQVTSNVENQKKEKDLEVEVIEIDDHVDWNL